VLNPKKIPEIWGTPKIWGGFLAFLSPKNWDFTTPEIWGTPEFWGYPEIWDTPEIWGTPNTPKTSFLKNQRKNAPRTFQTSK